MSTDEEADRERLLRAIESCVGGVPHARLRKPEYEVFHLHPVENADYRFSVWVYDDGEPQITARLLTQPEQAFWTAPFEAADYPSVEARNQAFLRSLGIVAAHPTVIEQSRTGLTYTFTCRANVNGAWQSLGGAAVARWVENAPKGPREAVQYQSPAFIRSEAP